MINLSNLSSKNVHSTLLGKMSNYCVTACSCFLCAALLQQGIITNVIKKERKAGGQDEKSLANLSLW